MQLRRVLWTIGTSADSVRRESEVDRLRLPVQHGGGLSTTVERVLLAAVPPILVYIFLQKQFIAGLTLGSTKG